MGSGANHTAFIMTELQLHRRSLIAKSINQRHQFLTDRYQQIILLSGSQIVSVDDIFDLYHESNIQFEAFISSIEMMTNFKETIEKAAKIKAEISKLNPDDEFTRIHNAGDILMKSLSIDIEKAKSLYFGVSEKNAINNALLSDDYINGMSRFFNDAQIKEYTESFHDMTLEQIRTSGKISQSSFDVIKDRIKAEKEKAGIDFISSINSLTSSSPLTNQAAIDKAERIDIDKQAKKSFRGGPYSGGKKGVDKLKADMAEIIQLTNGAIDVSSLIKVPRNGRANYSFATKKINVGSSLEKTTLWHEMAHSIERSNPAILVAVKGFLSKRLDDAKSKGKGISRLNVIYPKNKYSNDEVAIDDGAFSHYVTKLYRQDPSKPFSTDNISCSEVLSMGFESLSNPYAAGRLLVEDPDHAKFILGIIAQLRGQA